MPCGGYATFCAEGLCLVLTQLVLVMSHRWLKMLHNEFLNYMILPILQSLC
jgi:hypothetical protein